MVNVEDYTKKGNKTSLWVAYNKLVSNHEMMKVEMDMLDVELRNFNTTEEKFKKIIKGIELWSSAIPDNIEEIDQAIKDFRNRKMVEALEEDKGETLTALFG